MKHFPIALCAAAALATTWAVSPSALAQSDKSPGKQVAKIGYLSCHVAGGWASVSVHRVSCNGDTPAEKGKKIENYSGSIAKFGADIGYLESGVILWTALAPGNRKS